VWMCGYVGVWACARERKRAAIAQISSAAAP